MDLSNYDLAKQRLYYFKCMFKEVPCSHPDIFWMADLYDRDYLLMPRRLCKGLSIEQTNEVLTEVVRGNIPTEHKDKEIDLISIRLGYEYKTRFWLELKKNAV